jgi:hypothetical protein
MNNKMEFIIDIDDFPNTRDFYNTLRSFLTDKKKIQLFYNLSKGKLDNSGEDTEAPQIDIMNSVSFGLSFQRDRVKITMSFN